MTANLRLLKFLAFELRIFLFRITFVQTRLDV